MKISFKILEVNFGNSILDNSKWDSRSDYIAKKINIWNKVRLSQKGVIINQTLLSKLWYIGQICTFPKYTSPPPKEKNFLWNKKKMRPPRHLVQLSISMSGLDFLGTIKLFKSKMNSKVIKSQQCSLQKSHSVSI